MEPLPGISPLEARAGIRWQTPRWWLEVTARMVDGQYRVAESLLETPTPGFTIWDVRSAWLCTEHSLLAQD